MEAQKAAVESPSAKPHHQGGRGKKYRKWKNARAAMPAMSWKARLQMSLQANSSLAYSRYMQLATVKVDGTPAVRTVVFRGFLDDTDDLTFVTDQRSQKVQEIASNAAGEVAWYLPVTREQFRLTGTLTLVGADSPSFSAELHSARRRAWNKLSPPARAQFSWPQPGLPKDVYTAHAANGAGEPAAGDAGTAPTAAAAGEAEKQQQQGAQHQEPQQQEAAGESEPLPTFCLGVMRVSHVDYIQLFDNLRVVYDRGEDGEWASGVEVHP